MTYEFFSADELKCKCGECNSTGDEMSAAFMNRIVLLRRIYNKPLIVTSAYRCVAYNTKVSSTKSAREYTKGEAIDFKIAFEDAYRLLAIAFRLDFLRFGINQKGPVEKRFIHIGAGGLKDNYPQCLIWTYD